VIVGSSSKSHTIQFAVYMAFCIALMAISIKFPQVNASFQSIVIDITKPILYIVKKPNEWVDAAQTSVSGHVSVYEENIALKEELSDKQRLNRELSISSSENQELKSLLNMVVKVKGEPLTARVISDQKSAFSHTMIINTGNTGGIEKGQVVINKNGLVGRVLEVYDDASRILLLTDYASRIPVKILEANLRGIVRGTNSYNLELVFTEDKKIELEEGMVVVTTGAGGIFAEGLPVGEIMTIGKKVFIKPDVDFKNLDLVSIQRQIVKGIL
jgi:rod shape-determining protein MreC